MPARATPSPSPLGDAAAPVIQVQNLTKDYGTIVAVREVSFSVGRGEVVGFLGPNGAGKSTTLRILAGFLGASSGKVHVNGHDLSEDPLSAQSSLGYMPESTPLYPELRVREYLEFRARLKRVPRQRRPASIEKALARANVADVADTVIGHLSKGYRQRVGLADALLADPPLLILDEPTAGLDPNQVREVRRLIKELGEDHTILLSTHILSEVEATCQRALVIDKGRLVAQGSLAELSHGRRALGLRLTLRDPQALAEPLLLALPGVEAAQTTSKAEGRSSWLLTLAQDRDPGELAEQLVKELVGAGIGVSSVVPETPTLEQVFAELTRDERDEP